MDNSAATSMVLSKRRKQFRSLEERRRIVEEALAPGTSVAEVARAHGVNANLVFHWRKLYRAGLLSNPEIGGVRLLPVRVEAKRKNRRRCAADPRAEENGSVEVRFANSQVRIVGKVNEEVVRAVLESLLG